MKKIIAMALSLTLLLSVAACAPAQEQTEAPAVEASAAPAEASATPEATPTPDPTPVPTIDPNAEPYITIVDHAERTVEIPVKAERIVSGYYISSSILIALGLQDNLVGIEAKADTRPIYSLVGSDLLSLPNVGTAKEFNLEGAIALEPQLVVLPMSLKDVANTLTDEFSIPTIVINPESQLLLNESILMIAAATGTGDIGESLITTSGAGLGMLASAIEDVHTYKVYLGGNSDFLSTAGKNMYQNSLIELAGGENVANDIDDTYWATISYEQLYDYDPDVIFIAPAASYTVEDAMNDPALSSLDAVKNNLVYKMPFTIEAWDSPLPGSYLGALYMAAAIHSKEFTPEKYMDEVVDFYETYYSVIINFAGHDEAA